MLIVEGTVLHSIDATDAGADGAGRINLSLSCAAYGAGNFNDGCLGLGWAGHLHWEEGWAPWSWIRIRISRSLPAWC